MQEEVYAHVVDYFTHAVEIHPCISFCGMHKVLRMETATTTRLEWTTGDRLAKARTTAGISVEQMAKELGVSRFTIRNYEHDRTEAKKSVLRVWAEVTDVPLSWLSDPEIPASRCTLGVAA